MHKIERLGGDAINNVRQLLEVLYQQREERLPLLLATVVEVSGSAYRRPGTRMLITHKNDRWGIVSGGCLDRDLARRGWVLTRDGPRVVAYDTRGRWEQPAGDLGAGCDGCVFVLLERLGHHHNWLSLLLKSILVDRNSSRMATIYRVSTPADLPTEIHVGQKFFQSPFDVFDELEVPHKDSYCAITQAIRSHLNREDWPSETFSLQLQHPSLGSLDILFENVQPPPRVVVFGAGDDAIPIAALAQATGWDTLVCDKRAQSLYRSRLPGTRASSLPSTCQVVCCHPKQVFQHKDMQLSAADSVVLMTHDLDDDSTLLSQLAQQPVSYIGLLGPKHRTAKIIAELHRQGQLLDEEMLSKIRTPVGIDIGAEGPEEIAVSILAEIIADRNCRSGGPLYGRERAMHQKTPRETASFDLEGNFATR